MSIDSYDPDGNTLYVTPNYLKRENIRLDDQTQEKMNNLQAGEFGLILPQKLKAEEEKYQKMFKDYFSQLVEPTLQPNIAIAYVPNKRARFAYNNADSSAQQFLQDPIIVVLTPRSTGDAINAHRFWRSVSTGSTFYADSKQTTVLLKKHHLYEVIREINDSKQSYEAQVMFYRNQTILSIANALLGIIASAILFNAMNLLYFEAFRRDILIKQISGMTFGELHQRYLLRQSFAVALGFAINGFVSPSWISWVVTDVIIIANLILVLKQQVKKEEGLAVTILKGM